MPVLFFDEAHKLYVPVSQATPNLIRMIFTRPTLIRSREAMKSLLDSMLVLTKQDRLCHVVHATSDPFYQTWLRQLDVIQHCKVRKCSCCTDHCMLLTDAACMHTGHYHWRLCKSRNTGVLP